MKLGLVVSLLAFTSACEKTGAKKSALDAVDVAMLRDLPDGNVAIFGGDYMKMQDFMQTSLGGVTSELMQQFSGAEGMAPWMACFTKFKTHFVGSAALGDTLTIRFAMRGMTVTDIKACADAAKFPATLDPDQKYASVTLPMNGATFTAGYLALADGSVYSRTQVAATGVATDTRAGLEADITKAATASAAKESRLLEVAAKTDRSATFWFAGMGAGTAIADKLSEAYGGFSFEHGLQADIHFTCVEPSFAADLEKAYQQARSAASLGPDMKSFLAGIQLRRDDVNVDVSARFSDAQLDTFRARVKAAGSATPH